MRNSKCSLITHILKIIYIHNLKPNNMPFWAVAAPILAQVAQNVLQGVNTRKARLYDSPKEQVKRFQEAGLPMASTSRITTGGGFTTQANIQDPTPSIQANLGASLKREIDRKQIDLMKEQIKSAGARALMDAGEAKNKLNPSGVFEPTNQGTSMHQAMAIEKQSLINAETVNKFLPAEKALSLTTGNLNLRKLQADISNAWAQNNILLSEGKIKSILAQYQDRMSAGELLNLTRRNTGLKLDNKIKKVAFDVDYMTQFAKIAEAQYRAQAAGETVKSMQLNNMLSEWQKDSTRKWYEIKSEYDQQYFKNRQGWWNEHLKTGLDLEYLQNFPPSGGMQYNNSIFPQLLNLLK